MNAKTTTNPEFTDNAKALAALISLVATVSVLGQAYVFIGISASRGGSMGAAIWTMLGFFTILTNLVIAVVGFVIARGRWPGWWPGTASTLGCLAVNIVLVGIVYHWLLSGLWNPQGLHYWSDQGLHTAVPVLFFVFWIAYAPKAGLTYPHVLWWLIYPTGYFAYALIRGALDGWYPYPFIEVPKLGYPAVFLNAGLICAALAAGGVLLVFASRRLHQAA